MTRAFNEYARKVSLLKEKDKNLEGTDIREGLGAIVSVRIPEELLQFEGQTKGKLGTSEARSSVDAVISEKLAYFLEENPDVSSLLVKKQSKLLKRVKRHVRREKTQETGKNESVKKPF